MSDHGSAGDRARDRMAERFAAIGLDRDPFPESDLHVDFFSRGGRERRLDALADLWGLGRPLVLITGPSGVGRSTCFHALMRRLPDDVRSARVTAYVFLSARNLLRAVARAMGLAVDAEESREEVRDRLYHQIAELRLERTLCAVLVDDADELEADALEELVSLAELSAETPNVRVLLFGGEGLRRGLVDAVGEDRVGPLVHEVRLKRYTLDELRGYLQFRLARAGLSGASPFTEQDYQDIYMGSRGLPRAANVEARRLLLARGGRLSLVQTRIIAAAVSAFLVVGLLIILLGPRISDPEVVAMRELPLPVASAVDLTQPSGQPAELSGRLNSEPEPSIRDGGWLPLMAQIEADGHAELEDLLNPGDAVNPRSVEKTVAASVSSVSTAPVVTPAALTPVESIAQRERQAGETASGPLPKADAPTPRHALLERDPSRYVLQVLVLSGRDRAEAWVEERPEPSAYEIYRRTRDGATQYAVLQGDYPDRAAARAAAASVAIATGQMPFARDMTSVQAELLD